MVKGKHVLCYCFGGIFERVCNSRLAWSYLTSVDGSRHQINNWTVVKFLPDAHDTGFNVRIALGGLTLTSNIQLDGGSPPYPADCNDEGKNGMMKMPHLGRRPLQDRLSCHTSPFDEDFMGENKQ
jgi:hypothetical protein